MGTTATAIIPTYRRRGEYFTSQSWSDGDLDTTGIGWYMSVPRIKEAVHASWLLGGSPVFADPAKSLLRIKEEDFLADNIRDGLLTTKPTFDSTELMRSVNDTINAVVRGDLDAARNTMFGQMPMEAKLKDNMALNVRIGQVQTFADALRMSDGYKPRKYHAKSLTAALKEDEVQVMYDYFYHPRLKQWWVPVSLPDETDMWVPLVVAFAIEDDARLLNVIETLHTKYPEHYTKDIADMAAFNAAQD